MPKIFFFVFSFLLIFSWSQSILFWDNVQNSQEIYTYHFTAQSQEMTILKDEGHDIATPAGSFTASTLELGERYVVSLGNSGCPLISGTTCGVYYKYSYDCSCGGCHGCSTCYSSGYNYCDCPQNFGYQYEFYYINRDIVTSSASHQIQICVEGKGTGTLNMLSLIPINSCPSSFITMTDSKKGLYALAPNPMEVITLTADFKVYCFTYTITDYGCSVRTANSMMIGFNQGPFTLKNFVVSDPEKPESEDYLLARPNYFYTALHVAENRVVKTVSFINFNSGTFNSASGRFDPSITTLIGPSSGYSSLYSFNSVLNIHAKGPKNTLICAVSGSHLWGGSSGSTFTATNVPGNVCYIENFQIASDTLDLTLFDRYHNYSQIQNLFSSCGESCLSISIQGTQIIFNGVGIDQSSQINILYSNSPCFELCPDCRVASDCQPCQNCVPQLCDLEGCHQCNDPYYVSFMKCVETCPVGSFIDTQNRKCTQCNLDFCGECDKDFQCKTCLESTFLYQFRCLKSCPFRTYESIDNMGRKVCVDCKINCDVCNDKGCITCAEGSAKFLDLEGDGLLKCIPSSCQKYGKSLECLDTPIIGDSEDDYQSRNTLSYLLANYNGAEHFVCQTNIPAYFSPSCACYSKKSQKELGLLAISMSFMKIMKSKFPVDMLCNTNSSIFSGDCYYDSDNFDKIFNKTLTYEESITVLLDLGSKKYDINDFKYVFNQINGRNDYFVVLKIIQSGKIYDLLLLSWQLQFSEIDNSLLSFKEREVFVVSDPFRGCTDAAKIQFNLLFTYGKNDNYVIKSIDLYKRTTETKIYQDVLDYKECKEYVKVYDECKTSFGTFDQYYETNLIKASFYSFTWNKLSKVQKCAVLDIFCENGDSLILSNKDFRNYLEAMKFEHSFDWVNSTRYRNDMDILKTGKIPLILPANYPCVETIKSVVIDRSCDFSSIKSISQQLINKMINSTNGTVSELNPANFPNLGIAKNQRIFLETNTLNAFIGVLGNNPQKSFTLGSALVALPDQYLRDKWDSQCQNIYGIPHINDANNFLSGIMLELHNLDSNIVKIMQDNGFVRNGQFFIYSQGVNLQNENVKAFQKIWNCNFPEDLLEENGIFNEVIEKRLKISPTKGFGKFCPEI